MSALPPESVEEEAGSPEAARYAVRWIEGEQLPGRSHYGDGLDGDDAPRGAGLRLRRRAGADHDRRGVAARRSAAGVRPETLRRLRIHRLPVSPRQVSGSVGFWREVRFLLFSGSGTISTRGIRNFARPSVGRKFFCCQIARKGPKTTPFTKNIAHARAILSPKVARIARNYYFCSLFGGLYRGAADAPTPTRERNRFYRRDRCLQKKKRMPVWWGVLSPSISKSR